MRMLKAFHLLCRLPSVAYSNLMCLQPNTCQALPVAASSQHALTPDPWGSGTPDCEPKKQTDFRARLQVVRTFGQSLCYQPTNSRARAMRGKIFRHQPQGRHGIRLRNQRQEHGRHHELSSEDHVGTIIASLNVYAFFPGGRPAILAWHLATLLRHVQAIRWLIFTYLVAEPSVIRSPRFRCCPRLHPTMIGFSSLAA